MASRGTLSDAQKRRIEANRKRALERLQKRGISDQAIVSLIDPSIKITTNQALSNPSTSSTIVNEPLASTFDLPEPKRSRIDLDPQKKQKIEENRKKALQIKEKLQKNNRDATAHKPEYVPIPESLKDAKTTKKDVQPITKKRDYIDYDFSTMKDTHGGFMDDKEDEEINQSLEEWKEKQKQEHVVRDLAPPVDISKAPKCYECDALDIDPNLFSNFRQTRVCRRCAKQKPEKYALLTKTECKEDYLLTEPELQDVNLLARIEKPNPHGYSRMQLFLRFQVEEFATKKWGSLEKLDEEWEKREESRLKRKDKKYQQKIKEMRRKTRAEEYTRKLRNGVSLNDKHVHDWAEPIPFVKDDMNFVKKRCIDCGTEVEELRL